MNIACVYTVEEYNFVDTPLNVPTEIPFGIATIITALEQVGHNVKLFVVTPDTPLIEYIDPYIKEYNPKLFCFSAVSTQYWQVKKIANYVLSKDKNIFCILGGHEASLNPNAVINEGVFDVICLGEGETAVVEYAKSIETGITNKDISNLWFYDRLTGKVKKNMNAPLNQALDDLPYFNRKIWDEWITKPDEHPSLLLGRGCPFKCTYCSNHAMRKLAEGKYVRFRSADHIIGELKYITKSYPNVSQVYLEVETFGANRKATYKIFDALAEYNQSREIPLKFGVNFALTSSFMKNKDRIHKTLRKVKAANITTINIGLESGSERMRKEVLRRPPYTNDELVNFCDIAKTYGLEIVFFVLFGLPGETIDDYMVTVKVCRRAQPFYVYLSIYYPYLGTDLATLAIEMGLLTPENLTPEAERSRAVLNLDGFSSTRIRFEYIVFWLRVYLFKWPLFKVLYYVLANYVRAYPRMFNYYRKMRYNNWIVKIITRRYSRFSNG